METQQIHPTPQITISLATRTDVPQLIQVLSCAHLFSPITLFYLTSLPSTASMRPMFQKKIEDRMAQFEMGLETKILKATLVETGEIIGTATIYQKSGDKELKISKPNVEGGQDLIQGVNLDFIQELMIIGSEIEREVERLLNGKKHFVIDSFGVLPAYQRCGVGSLLLEECAKISDEYKLPTFLGALPEAHGLYVRHGYEPFKYADIDLGKFGKPHRGYGIYRTYAMLRKPQA